MTLNEIGHNRDEVHLPSTMHEMVIVFVHIYADTNLITNVNHDIVSIYNPLCQLNLSSTKQYSEAHSQYQQCPEEKLTGAAIHSKATL